MTVSFFRLFDVRAGTARSAGVRRLFCSLGIIGVAGIFAGCSSMPVASQPADPLESQLASQESAAVKSRSSYLADVANQKKEEAAEEAALAPNFNQGPGVIPTPGVH